MLEDEESWEILLDDVSNYIMACKSKNRGKGVVKAFAIILIDMSGPLSDGKDNGAKKVSFATTFVVGSIFKVPS